MIAVSNKVNLHPPQEQLQKFVAGEVSTGLSVAVSAHIEHCAACQQASAKLEQALSADWDAAAIAIAESEFNSILDHIAAKPQSVAAATVDAVPRAIVVNNKSVSLPRVLAKIAAAGLEWQHLRGGISHALVKLDDHTRCEFIYMKPGSKAPAHTHSGNEVMIVLDGSFCDELGEYQAADFVMRDPSHRHQPRSVEGCLCFSVLDSPLLFTTGLQRLLNPLNRLLFLHR